VIERVLDRLLDDLLGFGGGEAVLGLALEFGLAHEHRQHHRGADHDVFRGDGGGALALADALGVVLQASAASRCACRIHGCRRQASARCCSRRRGSRRRPRSRPPPIRRRHGRRCGPDLPEKMSGCTSVSAWIAGGEIVLQAAGEVEFVLGGTSSKPFNSSASQRQRIFTPPNR
jgi:hypothetical protein